MKLKQFKNAVSHLLAVGMLFVFSCCGEQEKREIYRTDALDNQAWDASTWISVVDAPVVTDTVFDGTRAADGASWFVSTVKNAQKVSRARWMTSALGVYDIYINGTLVGDEILKPGFTHYAKTRASFTYDITAAFDTDAAAENVLSAQVTPGWWADKIITPSNHVGMIGKKCAFRGVLELTYADGSVQLFGTDTQNWKAGIAGPVTHADIFDGEEYDARIRPGFETPDKLSAPEVNDEFIKDAAGAESVDAYRKETRERLEKQAASRGRDETENAIVEAISKTAECEIPQAMIESETDRMVQDFSYRLMYQGLKLEDYIKYMGQTMEQFRAQFADQAKSRVLSQLVIEKIIREEKISASAEEVDAKIAEQAASVGKTAEEYKKNIDPRQQEYITNDIVITKLFAFLEENNNMIK